MRKIYKILFILSVFTSSCLTIYAQNNFFSDISERSIPVNANRLIIPLKLRTISMDQVAMKTFLWSLLSGKSASFNHKTAPVIELPKPDGTIARFHVWESSIQEPGLELKYPDIKTFSGQGIDDPYATIRFDLTPRGFHAQVLSINGNYYIDPYAVGNTGSYISYFRQDLYKTQNRSCDVPDILYERPATSNFITAACRGTQLRTYRLAVANTGEYAQAPGINALNNPAILHSAIVTSINRVVGVFEKELSISLVLVANNNLVEFLDAARDPFTGNNNDNVLIDESQTVIDANIGSANYDIGHTFSTGGGGLATLNTPCGTSKARGITGSPSPTGDAYDIDFVAHEMGHQFGANHSMNSCGNSPNSTKFEPGSGTTVMAYAGICGSQDIQPNSDPFFHAISFDEISNFVSSGGGASCGILTSTGNSIPVVGSLTSELSIPVNTPFTLTGTATDPNGDALTYCWEQWDLGNPGQPWNNGATAAPGNTTPLFKSRIPKISGSRTFPDIRVILAGYPATPPATMDGLKGETLSPVERPMNFRLTVRDNRPGGGGVASSGGGGCQSSVPVTINVVGSVPFTVTTPNGGESYAGNSSQTFTWNVAGTNAAPVNVNNVRLTLSTDGGLTYPTILIASTPNDGSEIINIPDLVTTQARVKVEAIGNIFFDISDQNWNITAAASGFTFNTTTQATVSCSGPATATVVLGTTSFGGFTTPINLTATSGVPAGTNITFSTNPLAPGNSANVILNNINSLSPGTYNISISGVAGTVTQTDTVRYVVSPGTAPTITLQPVSKTICEGGNTSFTVAASGTVTYQWQVNTGNGMFFNITGANSPTYTLNSVSAIQNGNQYQVIVSAKCGSTTSAVALLTVNSQPTIITQPEDITICTGENGTLNVIATGGGLTYQWQVSTNGGGSFTSIPGATSPGYTINGVTAGMNNNRYRVIISGACPSPVTSSPALLIVGTAASITFQPVNQVVCASNNVSFNIGTSGTVTYQWQVSTNGGGLFTDIPGATSAILNLTAVTISMSGNLYRVIIFNCTGTNIISNNALLTVNAGVTITSQPVNTTVCAGNNITLSVTATGGGLSYQWQSAISCTGTFTNIAGATSATLNLNSVTAAMNGTAYRVIITSSCATLTSSCVTLTVNSPVTISVQPASRNTCLPSPDVTFNISAAGSGITYQWQVSSDGGGTFVNIPGANGSVLDITPTATLNGNQYRVVLSGSCTPNLVSGIATLSINSEITILAQPVAVNSCAGDSASFVVSASSSSPQFITYQWQVSSNGGGTFVNIPGATGNTLTVPSTLADNGNIYHAIVAGVPCGSDTTNDVSLTVNNRPAVLLAISGPASINPYSRTGLVGTVTPPGSSYIYAWYRNGILLPDINSNTIPVDVDGLGEYFVEVSDTNTNCLQRSNSVLISASPGGAKELFVYPNPSPGQFQVRYYTSFTSLTSHQLSVYDSKGAKVYQKNYPVTRVYDRMDVNLDNVSAGVYFLELRDSNGKRLASSTVMIR